jgi:hypothetical protein
MVAGEATLPEVAFSQRSTLSSLMTDLGHQRRFERLSTTSAVTPRIDIRLRRNI